MGFKDWAIIDFLFYRRARLRAEQERQDNIRREVAKRQALIPPETKEVNFCFYRNKLSDEIIYATLEPDWFNYNLGQDVVHDLRCLGFERQKEIGNLEADDIEFKIVQYPSKEDFYKEYPALGDRLFDKCALFPALHEEFIQKGYSAKSIQRSQYYEAKIKDLLEQQSVYFL